MESNKTRKLKVYISGAMTGYENKNIPRFHQVENIILGLMNIDIVNPAKLTQDNDWTHAQFMKRDLKALLECDRIILFDQWHRSRGALVEARVAASTGMLMTVLNEDNKLSLIGRGEEALDKHLKGLQNGRS